jgi:hypothetical protein
MALCLRGPVSCEYSPPTIARAAPRHHSSSGAEAMDELNLEATPWASPRWAAR